MSYEFSTLSAQHFEMLCGVVLAERGFRNVRYYARPGGHDFGIDWVFETSDGGLWVAQVKKLARPMESPAMFQQLISDLQRGADQVKAEAAILMLSQPVVARLHHTYDAMWTSVPIHLWDLSVLASMVDRSPVARKAYEVAISAEEYLEQLLQLGTGSQVAPKHDADELLSRLAAVLPGKAGWKEYEDICIEILSFLFIPPLRFPRIQTRSDDGLDQRDAIFPIGVGNNFWDGVKREFGCRMVVAEFKNHKGPIGQTEVESLEQYLMRKAKRSFGLLCCREESSPSALKARRRTWMTNECMILFLCTDDVREMVKLRVDELDPTIVLEAQLDDFFVGLAP